jgi:hypothetical protein
MPDNLKPEEPVNYLSKNSTRVGRENEVYKTWLVVREKGLQEFGESLFK